MTEKPYDSWVCDLYKSFGFNGDQLASFYKSNSKWEQGEELPLIDLTEENQSKAETSIKEILSNEITELIYVYDFLILWTFYVQIIEEVKSLDGHEYPNLIFSHGNISKPPPKKNL